MKSHKEIIETWFQRVWNEQDVSAIDEMFVGDGHARGLGGNPMIGPKDFKVFHATFRKLLSDIAITVDMTVETGEWISAICTLKAKDPKTKAPITMTGSVMIRIVNGKLIEAYNHWDFVGLYSQLGLLPAQSFEKGLRGERIV
jgi:hypothetical protein